MPSINVRQGSEWFERFIAKIARELRRGINYVLLEYALKLWLKRYHVRGLKSMATTAGDTNWIISSKKKFSQELFTQNVLQKKVLSLAECQTHPNVIKSFVAIVRHIDLEEKRERDCPEDYIYAMF